MCAAPSRSPRLAGGENAGSVSTTVKARVLRGVHARRDPALIEPGRILNCPAATGRRVTGSTAVAGQGLAPRTYTRRAAAVFDTEPGESYDRRGGPGL